MSFLLPPRKGPVETVADAIYIYIYLYVVYVKFFGLWKTLLLFAARPEETQQVSSSYVDLNVGRLFLFS